MSGWKQWQQLEVVTQSDLQNYIQDQVVQVYANSAARGSALSTNVTDGMVSYLTQSDSFEVYNGSTWVAVGGAGTANPSWVTAGSAGQILVSGGTANPTWQSLSRNYIINGAFEINQRSFSSTTTNNDFGFDRWRLLYSGGTTTYSTQSFTIGAAPFAPYESRNFARLVTTSQSANGNFALLQQAVEDIRTLAGATATISFFAKAASGTPKIAVEMDQNFGSGGSPSSAVQTYAGNVTLSTSWQRFSVTVAIPSISGKTLGTDNNSTINVRLFVSAGSDFNARTGSIGLQNNTFDIWGVQVEEGSVATPFRRNANSLQGELAACQRYYYRQTSPSAAYNAFGNGSAGNTTTILTTMKLPVTMRVAPTSIEWGSIVHSDGPNLITPSAITIGNATADTVTSQSSVTGATQFRPYTINANNSASAFIAFGAEL